MNKLLLIIIALLFLGILFFMFNIQQPPAETKTELKLETAQNNYATQTPTTALSPVVTLSSASATQQVRKATIQTEKGTVVLQLFPEVAPKTVANFVQKSQTGFYTGLTFHRVEDWVVQGGDPTGTGRGGGSIATEFNTRPFVKGAVGIARTNDPKIQNDAQFFIAKSDALWLNEQYTNFGMVTSGMDVVNKLAIGDKITSITVE